MKFKSTVYRLRRYENKMNEGNSAGKQLLLLLLGILMCCGGLYLFSTHIRVDTGFNFSGMYRSFGIFGSRGIPGGLVVIPLILGIVIWVIFPKSFAGKLVTILGALFIVFGVISSVELRWIPSTLYEMVLMLVLIFGGGALALRILFIPDLGKDKPSKKNKIDEINDKLN
jgi:protein-S-isoprenylcysteine O-methyltransferase Ste14